MKIWASTKRLLKEWIYELADAFLNIRQDYLYKKMRATYDIHPTFRFNGININLYGDGKISIGENTYVGKDTGLLSSEGREIKIGDRCRISGNVKMYTRSLLADIDFSKISTTEQLYKLGDIVIGNDVWIGVNVFINPGVTIGDNAVVGANSVVVSDIPPFAIYGGVPAKLIRFKKLP